MKRISEIYRGEKIQNFFFRIPQNYIKVLSIASFFRLIQGRNICSDLHADSGPIAQWTEYRIPVPVVRVQLPLGPF